MSENPDETAYYLRLLSMYMDLGTETVLDVFVHHSPGKDPHAFLKSKEETLIKLKANGILNKQECKLLLVEDEWTSKITLKYQINLQDFDISLLITLAINLFSKEQLPPPKKGWENPPRNSDKSIAADLLRLRKTRNVIVGHHPRARLPQDRFEEEWQNVSEILLRIQQQITKGNGAFVQVKIDSYGSQILDPCLKNKYDENLKEWHEDVSKMQDKVEDLLKKVDGFNAYFKNKSDWYERYAMLLVKGGRFVLSSFLAELLKKQGRDMRTILDENKETIQGSINDSKHLDVLYPSETNSQASPSDMSSWNVSILAAIIQQLFDKDIDRITKQALKGIHDAYRNYAENALLALDSNIYFDYRSDLQTNLNIVSGHLSEDHAAQYQQILDDNKKKIGQHEFQTFMDELKTQGTQMKSFTDIFKETLQKTKDCLQDMITRGVSFKTSHVLELKMITLGTGEEKKQLAENILTEIWHEALDRSTQYPEFADVKKEVENILDEIRKSKSVKKIKVKQACIILQISCTSPSDMLYLIGYFESSTFYESLDIISKELGYHFNTAFAIKALIPVDNLWGILNHQSDLAVEKDEGIRVPISVSSPAGLLKLRSLLNSEKITNSTNSIADALSKHLNETIMLKVETDMKKFRDIFEEDSTGSDSSSDSPISESNIKTSTQLFPSNETDECFEEQRYTSCDEKSLEDKTENENKKAPDRYNISYYMDTASAINRELLECPICCCDYNYAERVPRNLGCGHAFCTSCLKELLKEKNIICPLCQTVYAQKDSDVGGIPQDFTRQSAVDIFNNCEKRQICTQCDESNTAIHFCNDCEKYICYECTHAHKRTNITKAHKLRALGHSKDATFKSDSEGAIRLISCKNEKYSDQQISLFCLNCNKDLCDNLAVERHTGHQIKQLKEVFLEQQHELKTKADAIRQINLPDITKRLEEMTEEVKEKGKTLKNGLTRQFETYNKIITERLNVLKSQVDKATESITESLQNNKDLTSNVQHKLSEADRLLKEKNPVSFLKSSQYLAETLTDLQSQFSKLPEVAELHYSQTCTTEDFDKIVGALGSVQGLRPQTSDGGYIHGVTQERSMETSFIASLPYESLKRDQLMEVLKSPTSSDFGENQHPEAIYRSSKLDLCEEQHSIKNEPLENVPETVEKDIPSPVKQIERNMPKGKRDLMRSESVKRSVRLRFQTRELEGYWAVDDDKVEMFSRSSEEADECMQLLKETVLEKTLKLRKGSAFIVDSDNWQIITGNLKRKYPDQVQIEVNQENREVIIYSTCTTILKDTCDAMRIFLRNNQMKIITLTYEAPVVTFIMKHKRRMQKIQNDFSEYCLDISPVDSSNILLKGIGFKVVQALRMIHALGSKYTKSTEEDRFDSDGKSEEDDEEQFGGEKEVYCDTAVQMHLDIECKQTLLRALCFPIDDKQIFVTMGDITELPVEALVNAADKTLKHRSGLSKALVEKGGRSIQEDCTDYVQRHGDLQAGQVYCSNAGSLACSVIIHAVGPKWNDGKNDEQAKLSECITNCMKTASRLKLSSIAFPAVSAGAKKFPIQDATLTITKAVNVFLRQRRSCSVREIYFCDQSSGTVNEFAMSLKESYGDEDIIFSSEQKINEQSEHEIKKQSEHEIKKQSEHVNLKLNDTTIASF